MAVVRTGRPGLLGTVARAAVVAGTASMTVNAINRHAPQRSAESHSDDDQQRAAPVAAALPASAATPSAGGAPDLLGELERLSQLRQSGALTDTEFTEFKARLLG